MEPEPALFSADLDPGRKHQACDRCQVKVCASDDALRVRGWQVYDGTSFTGKPLNVRICRPCQTEGECPMTSETFTNWDDYRACSQVCRAPMGKPCFSLSGRVVNGQPDGVRTELSVPHAARKRRTGRKA